MRDEAFESRSDLFLVLNRPLAARLQDGAVTVEIVDEHEFEVTECLLKSWNSVTFRPEVIPWARVNGPPSLICVLAVPPEIA
jgi:hypothetical protein